MAKRRRTPPPKSLTGKEEDALFEVLTLGTEDDIEKQVRQDPRSSKQLDETIEIWEGSNLGNKIIEPPFNPTLGMLVLSRSTRLRRAIWIHATNVAGLGFAVTSRKIKEDTSATERKRILKKARKEIQTLEKFYERPNAELPLCEIMRYKLVDKHSTGTDYLEVVRNLKDEPIGLNHVPSHTIRILKRDLGYVQVRGEKKVFFKLYGDLRIVDSRTGGEDPNTDIEFRATELIKTRIYSARSSHYGVPVWEPASLAISGTRMTDLRNVLFMEHDSTPRCVFAISGGQLTSGSAKQIHQFMARRGKGLRGAHRALVIQVDRNQGVFDQQAQAKIQVIPLTVGVQDDASFQKYRGANSTEIKEAFGHGDIYYTANSSGRASSLVDRMITNEQAFAPDRDYEQWVLNNTISRELLVGPDGTFGIDLEEEEMFTRTEARLTFKAPNLVDPLDKAREHALHARSGAKSGNDIRNELGLEPFPEPFGKHSVLVELELIRQGILLPNMPGRQNSPGGRNATDAPPKAPGRLTLAPGRERKPDQRDRPAESTAAHLPVEIALDQAISESDENLIHYAENGAHES